MSQIADNDSTTDAATETPANDTETNSQPVSRDMPFRLRLWGGVSFIVCLAVYVLRLDRVIGSFVDDAWYVLLAQALATGQGYSLINSPTPGIFPLYPPAFPVVLSVFYRLGPAFPDNVWLLKSVSVAAMLGVGFLSFRYFTRERQTPGFIALGLATASVLSPSLVYLATTTVMSECFYAFVLLMVIWLVDRGVRRVEKNGQVRFAVLAGLMASIAFLTRSISIGMLAGVFFYLLAKRFFVAAGAFTLTVALLCGPWVIYSSARTPNAEQRFEQMGHIVLPYHEQFWQRMAGDEDSGTQTWKDLPERLSGNLAQIALIDMTRILATPLFETVLAPDEAKRFLMTSPESPWGLWLVTLLITGVVLFGYFLAARERATCLEYVMPGLLFITVLWPWQPYRFIVPLIPFFLYYLWRGVTGLGERWLGVGAQQTLSGATVAVLVLMGLWGNGSYLLKQQDFLAKTNSLQTAHTEVESLMAFLKTRLKPNEPFAAANAPQAFLYTGHKTIGVGESAKYEAFWKKIGIRYLVNLNVYGKPDDPTKTGYKVVYRSKSFPNQIWIVSTEP